MVFQLGGFAFGVELDELLDEALIGYASERAAPKGYEVLAPGNVTRQKE